MDITQAFIKFRDDIKELIANNLNAIGKPSVAYNEETDNIDFYTENGVRSIATGLNEPVALVPVLSVDDGKVIYSENSYQEHYAWQAFNGTATGVTDGAGFGNPNMNSYVGYNFNSKRTVTKIFIKNRFLNSVAYTVSSAKTFKLQGSNDLSNWYDIQEFVISSGNEGAEEYFIVDNPQQYSAFRIFIMEVSNTAHVFIAQLQFYGYNEIGVALPEATKNATVSESDVFSVEKEYAVGDYCIYDDILYKFTAEKATGEWDESVVENTTVVKELRGGMDLLWENPDPTTSFAEQDITLASGDYEYYEVFYFYDATAPKMQSVKSCRGYGVLLSSALANNNGTANNYRIVSYVSDTVLTVGTGYFGSAGTMSNNNNKCVPVKIVGYKL